MTPEPLKGKIHNRFNFNYEDIKSTFEWMVQPHEERIEELIKEARKYYNFVNPQCNGWEPHEAEKFDNIFKMIEQEYKSIMIIEAGLEDVL